MKKMWPNYNLPSRKYFTDNIIPCIYWETKAEIEKVMDSSITISITTDLLTITKSLQSFLSFTAHWLNDNFQFQHTILQVKHYRRLRSADNIKQHSIRNVYVMGYQSTKIHTIVWDNSINMEASWKMYPCTKAIWKNDQYH